MFTQLRTKAVSALGLRPRSPFISPASNWFTSVGVSNMPKLSIINMTLVRNCVNMFGNYNVGLVCTNHTYASQDMFDPDDKISGGQGFIYASSIVVAMKKMKLKEDEDGNKISEVMGIRAGCKVMKTRYAKPFEGVQVKIPYETGMNPYSGLTDLAEKKGLLKKDGNRLMFVTSDGEIIKQFRKAWESNEEGCLDKVMADFANQRETVSTEETATEE